MSEIRIEKTEDGYVGVINGEPVTTRCVVKDAENFRVRGMRIPLVDGYEMSVVFSTASYSVNKYSFGGEDWHEVVPSAEIAVISPDEAVYGLFSDEWGDEVKGYCDAAEILGWVLAARSLLRNPARLVD